tara:strand:+ start:1384 stop:1590 length:207 start_codon:yes stop_codon:yes gene_type:complete
MIVCLCKGVTQDDLDEALSAADESLEMADVIWMTEATTGCGSCKEYIEQLIERWLSEQNTKKRKKRLR